jgi:hypothetical protein
MFVEKWTYLVEKWRCNENPKSKIVFLLYILIILLHTHTHTHTHTHRLCKGIRITNYKKHSRLPGIFEGNITHRYPFSSRKRVQEYAFFYSKFINKSSL